MPTDAAQDSPGSGGFHAWSPGIEPSLPRSVRPLATVFRRENVEQSFREIEELADFSGLPAVQLALFRPERLVVHEVMVRVMADLCVPIGSVYADHGVNFRAIVARILHEGIDAHLPDIAARVSALRAEADVLLDGEIAALLDDPAPQRTPGRRWFFGSREPAPRVDAATPEERQARALRRLSEHQDGDDSLEGAVREALHAVVASVSARQGVLIRDRALLRRLAGILVSNGAGSRRVGQAIEPLIESVVAQAGYRRLTPQPRPVVMNVKGASASGKSTIRPYQRRLAERIGADWSDFAVITPDVWRKFLLDYDSLGEARRYAGPLTGHEIEIVDAKLDRYMARKAADGRMSHLLIDRFRFDSFALEPRAGGASQLLTRFGDRIYLQFMVTPPEATVERAWKRGEQFGRYKAVEDLLAHNVEAFGGMPRLFFLWALRRDKTVFFEFLDNSVKEGCTPQTIAFGTNDAMTILEPRALIDIDCYRKIDIHARSPAEVYAAVDRTTEYNAGFLRACLKRLASVRFAERETGRVYARFDGAKLTTVDRAVLARINEDAATRGALLAVGLPHDGGEAVTTSETLRPTDTSTLGAWGSDGGRAEA